MPEASDFLARHAHRLVARSTPGAWIGLVVRVVRAHDIEDAGLTLHLPAHFLGAAWSPLEAGPARWPQCVVIGSPRAEHAIERLFTHLPGAAQLFLTDRDGVDAALCAAILLAGDRNLQPYQREGLAAFVADERERTARRIAGDYHDRDAGFERFRDRVLGCRSQDHE